MKHRSSSGLDVSLKSDQLMDCSRVTCKMRSTLRSIDLPAGRMCSRTAMRVQHSSDGEDVRGILIK